MKYCSKCHVLKPVTYFNNSKKTKDGKREACRDCEKIAHKIYRKNNAHKMTSYADLSDEQRRKNIESVKKWNKAHKAERTLAMAKRRALKRQNGCYVVTPKEINKLQNMVCLYCGSTGGEIDHVIPLSRGGTHSIGNLVAACKPCNASKNNRTITEWKKRKAAKNLQLGDHPV